MNVLKTFLIGLFVFAGSFASADQTVTYLDGDNDPNSYTAISTLFLTVPTGTATQSGPISGSGFVDKEGDGSLLLTGTNIYTGPTVLTGGTLALGGSAALGSTSIIYFSGGTLQYTSANMTDYSSLFATVDNEQFRVDTNG